MAIFYERLVAAVTIHIAPHGYSLVGRVSPLGSVSLCKRATCNSFSLAVALAASGSGPFSSGDSGSGSREAAPLAINDFALGTLSGGCAILGSNSDGAASASGGDPTRGNDCTSLGDAFACFDGHFVACGDGGSTAVDDCASFGGCCSFP